MQHRGREPERRKRTPTIAISHMGTAIKHSVPDRVKQSFVIFDIWALWRSGLKVTVAGCQKLQMTAVRQMAKVAQNVHYCVKCYIFHQAHVIGTWKQSLQKSQSVYTVSSQQVTQQPVTCIQLFVSQTTTSTSHNCKNVRIITCDCSADQLMPKLFAHTVSWICWHIEWF